MCEWGGCWRSVEACVSGEGVGGVWMGRVLGECEACVDGEGVGGV